MTGDNKKPKTATTVFESMMYLLYKAWCQERGLDPRSKRNKQQFLDEVFK